MSTSLCAQELTITNARIIAANGEIIESGSIVVRGGSIVSVEPGEPTSLVGTTIDAEGMTITPGFIDAHSHASGAGVNELVQVNVDLRSIREIKSALLQRANITPAGEWIRGFKYDDTKLAEGRPLNRFDIDEVVPDHPVVVGHRGGHRGLGHRGALCWGALPRAHRRE